MRAHVIGLGGAGGRIADRLAGRDADRFPGSIFAFDTDAAALDSLRSLDDDRRRRFGDAAGGDGLDGDLHAGREVGRAHASELCRALDDGRPSLAEAFVLVVGVGGAAGGGVAPPLAVELSRLYDAPVYAVAVLPTPAESDPEPAADSPRRSGSTAASDPASDGPRRPLAAKNAARTLNALSEHVAAVVAFDNEAWLRRGDAIADARGRLNDIVAERIAAVFGVGEAGTDAATPQQVVDASDVARALGDDGAVASVGYATQAVETPTTSRFGLGVFDSAEPATVDTSAAVSAIETVIRKATRGKNTVAVPGERTDRALLVVGGPPAWLNRSAIADGRRWLAEETGSGAILSGDAPVPDGDAVFALVVRSGIDEPERLRAIRASTG